MRVSLSAAVLLSLFLLAPCLAQTATDAEALSWNHKPFADSADDFHFAIVADNTGGLRPGVFDDAMHKLNLLRPAFVMCVGDLIEGYTDDDAELDGMWDEFAGMIDTLDAPFFGTVGNHDVSNEKMSEYVESRFSPTRYYFVYSDVLFVCLDSQDDPSREDAYRSGLSTEQVAFVRKTLADNASVRWTFLFLHQPLFDPDYADAPGWDRVESILASRPHTVFAGHEHKYAKYSVNGHDYYRLGTTGGGSELRGPARGELDHVMWVTMTSAGPVIASLALDGILADDFATDQTALAYDAAATGSFLGATSIVTDQRPFKSAVVTLNLENVTDFPLSVTTEAAAPKNLSVEPARVEEVIAPHSTKAVNVSVAAPVPLDPASLEPFRVEWSARYDVPDRAPIDGAGTTGVIVEGIHACPKAAAQVSVDSDLAEWPALPERFNMPMEFARNASLWRNRGDSSVSFATAWDDNYLYLAFAVTDDVIVIDDEHTIRQQDALTILVDPRTHEARATPSKDWKDYVSFVFSPGAAPGQEKFGNPLPEGTKAVSVITPNGYNTEIAIPVALLDAAAGGQWSDFRLNIRLHDLDANDWNTTLMWWRPSWDGPGNYTDSGTFIRR